jgi:hypothetical protein
VATVLGQWKLSKGVNLIKIIPKHRTFCKFYACDL